jgi:hypothetical protein
MKLILGVLVILLAAVPARAVRRTAVVAPLNPLGIEQREIKRVQRWLTAAASSVRGYRWLLSSRLQKLQRSLGKTDCTANAGCLAELARRLDVDYIVTGDVGSLSGAYMVYLRLANRRGKRVQAVSGVLDPRRPGLKARARELAIQLLAPDHHTGALRVKVDVPNAWIYLDGERIARSPAGIIKKIPVGTHALRVTHEAYRDFVRFVKIPFHEAVDVEVAMSAFPVKTGRMALDKGLAGRPLTDEELPWYRRWWVVATVGVAVLAATTTTMALLAGGDVPRDAEVVVGGR